MKKLNRIQLRKLIIESVTGDTELETITNTGVNVFNALLKKAKYFPSCSASPSLNEGNFQIEIKCPSGSENKIISFLEANESQLINSPGYNVVEHTYEIIRPGRIGVHLATFD